MAGTTHDPATVDISDFSGVGFYDPRTYPTHNTRRVTGKFLAQLQRVALNGNTFAQINGSGRGELGAVAGALSGLPSKPLQGVQLYMQDTAPTVPATDDLWYETDTNILWFYDGTRWLSAQLFSLKVNFSSITGTTDYYMPIEVDHGIQHDLYLVDLCGTLYQNNNGNPSATHYWKVELSLLTAGLSGGIISTLTTQNNTVSNFVVEKNAIDTAYDISATAYTVALIRASIAAGSPGTFIAGVEATYRLVHL